MAAGKRSKLETVEKLNPELSKQVSEGKMTATQAYNEAKRAQLGLSEYRGTSTKKNQFAVDFKRIIALHNPSQEELVAEIKKAYPLTWKSFIRID